MPDQTSDNDPDPPTHDTHSTMMTETNDSPTSVEETWRKIFTRHDNIDEEQADLFVKLAFGNPKLTRGVPDADTIRDVVDESLSDIDYESHLDDDTDPEAVHDELMEALEEGLEGRIVGPSIAPSSIAEEATDAPATEQVGPSLGPSTSADDVAPQPYKGKASKVSDGKLDDLADVLEDIMEEYDLEVMELQGALERVRERREE